MVWDRDWTKDWVTGFSAGWKAGEDNAPPRLNGLTLWLDASDTALGSCSRWVDKSGNGNNSDVQGTAAKQPTNTADQLNSQRVMLFDNGDTLVFTSKPSLFALANGDSTVFVVSRTINLLNADYAFIMTEAGSGRLLQLYLGTNNDVYYQSRTSAANGVTFTTGLDVNYQIIRGRHQGTTQAISINGAAEVTNASGQNESGVDAMYLGSRADIDSYFNGGIAEILMYNRSLSTAEIAAVELYLSNKWNIITPLQFSPTLWLDANDPLGTGTPPADGTALSTWADKSGNGNNFTQATGASQPIFNTGIQNGLSAVTFNGSKVMNSVISLFTGNPSFSTFAVIKCTSLGANRIFLGTGTGSGAYQSYGYGYNFGFGQSYTAFEWAGEEVLYGPIVGNMDVYALTRSNSTNSSTLWINNNLFNQTQGGAPAALSLDGSNTTLGAHSNGTPINWIGYVSELIVLPYIATTEQRLSIQTYLKNKWSIT